MVHCWLSAVATCWARRVLGAKALSPALLLFQTESSNHLHLAPACLAACLPAWWVQVPQELYPLLPLALAPVLGNPVNLLAAGVDGSASVQQQAAQLVNTALSLLRQLPRLADILPAGGCTQRWAARQWQPQLHRVGPLCSAAPGMHRPALCWLTSLHLNAPAAPSDPLQQMHALLELHRYPDHPSLLLIYQLMHPPAALSALLTADTLSWKLEVLAQGAAHIAPLLPRVQQRVLVLVGDGDILIPSAQEGPRLQRALPRAHTRVMRGYSHALLQVGWGSCLR